jgi:hypothetical protein
MKQESDFDVLESYFSFLVQEYDFILALRQGSDAYGGSSLEFHSPRCWVIVGLDRSSVFVLVAPTQTAPDCWIELSTIVSYLTNGQVDDVYKAYGVRWQRELPYLGRVKAQARKLAPAFKDYLPAICDLFSNTPNEEACSALQKYARERDRRRAGLIGKA